MKPRKTSLVLAVLFSTATVLAVAAVALVLRFGVEVGFQTYLDAAQGAAHARTMAALEALTGPGGTWDRNRVAALGRQALDQGLVLSVTDARGQPVWGARVDEPQAVAQVFHDLESRLRARVPWERGRWEAWEHPVTNAQGTPGTMKVELFQPRRLGPSDLAFLEGLDSLLAAVALGGMVLGALAGVATARGLVRPLQTLGRVTQRLGAGDYSKPLPSGTPFAEVRDLEADLAVLADRLGRLQALRDTSGADTAHELRTPLANLEAQLEALEDGVLTPDPGRFAALGQETRRLHALVQAWEDLERARTAAAVSGFCAEPGTVVREVAGTFAARLGDRSQRLELVLGTVGPLPLAPHDLGRIVVNLVENAHRHAPEGGTITVSLAPVDGGTGLVVDDDGPGIPEEHREAVFDRFYRVDPSRSRRSGGLGLGLSLVRVLVVGAGGSVEAQTSPRGGCRIQVWLPPI